MSSDPLAKWLTDFHAYRWEPEGVEIHLERFSDVRDTFSALVTCVVATEAADDPILVSSPKRLNFQAERSVTSFAKHVAYRLNKLGLCDRPQAEWEERLEHVSYHSWLQFQEGASQLQQAAKIEVSADDGELLAPLIARSGVTMLYGDASSGKSMLAKLIAVLISAGHPLGALRATVQGPVIYYDWEDSEEVFYERVAAICQTLAIDIPESLYYRSVDRSITAGESRIRREIENMGAVFAVFDSVGEMLGGSPREDEYVIPAINVLKRTRIPTLALHHLNAEQTQTADLSKKQRPFGSIYARTGARKLWLLDRFQEEEADEGVIFLTNTKVNRGKKSRRLSFIVEYDNGVDETGTGRLRGVRYTQRSASDYFDMLRAAQPHERQNVIDILRGIFESSLGSAAYPIDTLTMRVSSIRGEEVKEQTVRNKLRDLVNKGVLTSFARDGRTHWVLASRRADEPVMETSRW